MPTVTQFRLGADVVDLSMGDDPGVFYSVGEATTPPLLTQFPNEFNCGVNGIPGWEPETVVDPGAGEIHFINEEGAVIEDTRFVDCYVIIQQPHVTLRRCELVGGAIYNYEGGTTIANDFLFEDSTVVYSPAGSGALGPGPTAIGIAGFTMRRSALLDVNEGIRTGGSGGGVNSLLDPSGGLSAWDVNIIDSYIRIHGPNVEGVDWHGDCWEPGDTGLPGGGVKSIIRNSVFWCNDEGTQVGSSCMTTGFGHMLPFDINGLILSGGGYSYYARSGGDFRNMYFHDDSWFFGAMVTDDPLGWARTTTWENVKVCTIDVDGQPDVITGTIPYGWDGGAFDPP